MIIYIYLYVCVHELNMIPFWTSSIIFVLWLYSP